MPGNKRFIIANITWNDSGWRNIYVNPHAGHAYARTHPGHESLNFEFNKGGLDTTERVFGFVQWTNSPTALSNDNVIFFFSKNLSTRRNEIVGLYGNAEILARPLLTSWNGFEKNELTSNIAAAKALSLLFPVALDTKGYFGGKRVVPQVGFRYIGPDLAGKIVVDEIEALKISGMRRRTRKAGENIRIRNRQSVRWLYPD
jgi:hypothetical protein